jgi:hypothetical protein
MRRRLRSCVFSRLKLFYEEVRVRSFNLQAQRPQETLGPVRPRDLAASSFDLLPRLHSVL